MIIVDSQQELAGFVKSLNLDSVGTVKMDLPTFELARPIQGELAFVHAEIYGSSNTQVLSRLESLSTIILYDPNKAVKNLFANTIMVVDKETPTAPLKNLIIELEDMLREKQVLKSQLISINQELSDIMGNVETEMLRIKKMYEVKTPRRFQDIKGVQVYSKYTAGENVGGEFFDIFMEQNKLFILMSATSSYLASSLILKIFSQYKSIKDVSPIAQEQLIYDIKAEVQKLNSSKKKEITLDLFTAVIDLNKHVVSGHLFGKFRILSSASNNYYQNGPNIFTKEIIDGAFSRTFERGERILLCSPGFTRNWDKLSPDFMIEEMILNKKIRPLDILDEIFFQLRKDSTSGFLSYDASAIILEVQKNAMVEV